MKNFHQFVTESLKFLSVPEILEWLEDRSNHTFIALDTETTGLRGPRYEQLTQIAAVAFKYNPSNNRFEELGNFNEKIKLLDSIKAEKGQEGSKIVGALKFNRYGSGGGKYYEEQQVISSLLKFIQGFPNVVLLVQNAPFDLPMINIRSKFGRVTDEIFDTKNFFAYYLIPTLEGLAREGNTQAQETLDRMGKTHSGRVYSSSLPKVAGALGVGSEEAHDALFDCRYMVKTLEKAIDVVKQNPHVSRKEFIRPRVAIDRWTKMKSKEQK